MKSEDSFKLKSDLPAAWPHERWKDAFPSGNGIVGIAVYGAVKKETILVNHGKLWHWGKRGVLPDVSDAFQKARRHLFKGEYQAANSLTAKALLDAGYESELYTPCPVGDILISMDEEAVFHNYERCLNMETGEVAVKWDFHNVQFERRAFVSRIKDVIVLSVKASKAVVGMQVSMKLHETGKEDMRRMKEESSSRCYKQGDCLVYETKTQEGSFGITGKVVECDGDVDVTEQELHVKDAAYITIVFKVFGDMDETKDSQQSIVYLNGLKDDYESLLREHQREHGELFHSAGFQINTYARVGHSNEELLQDTYRHGISNELCEKLWNYGRYLFLSGTRPEGYPFPLYGLWGGGYRLVWSHNMANINIQMIYWHCISGGYEEYIRALIDYYHSLLPDFRENAKKVFGLEGIYVPAGTTPGYGLMNQIVPVIVNWIGAAGWISQHMYEYYLITEDEQMLSEKILPFMEAAALFYEQYLVEEDGEIQIIPSVSPENTPGNLQGDVLFHMSHVNPTVKNAAMDIAIIKELLRNLISISVKEQRNIEKIPVWKKIIEGLPVYKVNQDGAVKEWASDDLEDFYYHRHLSHLYPVFPGRELLTLEDVPLKDAFHKAVKLRVQGGQSGWSLAQLASVYARLGEGEQALECLEILTRGCLTSSFLTLHNDWRDMGLTLDLHNSRVEDKAPVQLDALLGAVNAMQEMVFQYAQGIIFILPALPKAWDKGKVQGFQFYTGSIDLEWKDRGSQCKCSIYSRKKQLLTIRFSKILSEKRKFLTYEAGRQEWFATEQLQVELHDREKIEIEII